MQALFPLGKNLLPAAKVTLPMLCKERKGLRMGWDFQSCVWRTTQLLMQNRQVHTRFHTCSILARGGTLCVCLCAQIYVCVRARMRANRDRGTVGLVLMILEAAHFPQFSVGSEGALLRLLQRRGRELCALCDMVAGALRTLRHGLHMGVHFGDMRCLCRPGYFLKCRRKHSRSTNRNLTSLVIKSSNCSWREGWFTLRGVQEALFSLCIGGICCILVIYSLRTSRHPGVSLWKSTLRNCAGWWTFMQGWSLVIPRYEPSIDGLYPKGVHCGEDRLVGCVHCSKPIAFLALELSG